jgi:hypothetical protein
MGLDGDVGDVPVLDAVIDRTGEAIADPSNDGSSASSMSGEKSKGFLLVGLLGVSKGAAVLALLCESKERGEAPLARLPLSRIITVISDISEWGQGGGSFPSALVRKPYSSDLTTALGPMCVATSLPSSPSDASLTIDTREPRDVLLGRLMLNPPSPPEDSKFDRLVMLIPFGPTRRAPLRLSEAALPPTRVLSKSGLPDLVDVLRYTDVILSDDVDFVQKPRSNSSSLVSRKRVTAKAGPFLSS